MKPHLHSRSEIHLGDLIQALNDLPWQTDEQARKIAESLGFSQQSQQQHQVQKSRSAHNREPSEHAQSGKKLPSRRPQVSALPPPTPQIKLPEGALPGSLTSPPDRPPSVDEIQRPDQHFERFDDKEYPPVTPPSLIRENTSRGVLSALLQTSRESQRIEIKKLIRLSLSGLLPKRFPYQETGTLDYGCQLLLDFGDSMTPWWDDLETLCNQLEKVMGKDLVTRYHFNDEPLLAECWSKDMDAESWQPKPPTPILVATDFGLPVMRSEYRLQRRWREFIKQCEIASCPLIFLIPWEYDAWLTRNLGAYPYLFRWSPKTSANQIRSLIGIGHRAAP